MHRLPRKLLPALVVAAAVVVIALWMLARGSPVFRTGEYLEYQVTGTEKGSFSMEIEGRTFFRGDECYSVSFSLSLENRSRTGSLLLTPEGELKYCWVRMGGVEGFLQVWEDIGKLQGGWMAGKTRVENWLDLPLHLTSPEHFLLALRCRHLGSRYYGEFNMASLPFLSLVPSSATCIGQERVKVPAGEFDCWVLQLEGWNAKIWVSKSDGLVPKFQEKSQEENLLYELVQRRFYIT